MKKRVKKDERRTAQATDGQRPDGQMDVGPRPIVILLIVLSAIIVLAALSAAARVFLFPDDLLEGTRCNVRGPLPDPVCSPGDIFQNATKEVICQKGYSASVRDVPQDLKDRVYAEYGITSHTPYAYEIDHIISLELGGSNDIKNLYPEAAVPVPGYHEKDRIENLLHKMVCNGSMDLGEAQHIIATNWTVMLDATG